MTLTAPGYLRGSMAGRGRPLLAERNQWVRDRIADGNSVEIIAAALRVKPTGIRNAIAPKAPPRVKTPVTPLPVCGADAIRARLIEETRKDPETALLVMMRCGAVRRGARA